MAKRRTVRLGVNRFESWYERLFPGFLDVCKASPGPDDEDLAVVQREWFAAHGRQAYAFGLPDGSTDADRRELQKVWLEAYTSLPSMRLLRSWMNSQQAFVFDPGLSSVLDVGAEDGVPFEAFASLPFGCFYVEWGRTDGYDGFLFERSQGSTTIVFVDGQGDVEGPSVSMSVAIEESDGMSVGQAVDKAMSDMCGKASSAERDMVARWLRRDGRLPDGGVDAWAMGLAGGVGALVGKAMAHVVYLAAANADVRPVPRSERRSYRRGAYSKVRQEVSEVGFEVGASLRRMGLGGSGQGKAIRNAGRKRPHVRRAHWHSFNTGPRDAPTGVVVHWLPPVVVNANEGDVVPVSHAVG